MPEHTPGPTQCRGVYGFVMHLVFNIGYLSFVLWAAIPEKWFYSIGITYLPQRYWAVAVPIFSLTVIALFAFIIYPSLGLLMTPSIDSLTTITDQHSIQYNVINVNINEATSEFSSDFVPCVCIGDNCVKNDYENVDLKLYKNHAIPAVMDLDIATVSETLYL